MKNSNTDYIKVLTNHGVSNTVNSVAAHNPFRETEKTVPSEYFMNAALYVTSLVGILLIAAYYAGLLGANV